MDSCLQYCLLEYEQSNFDRLVMTDFPRTGFWRRAAAWLYDALVIIAFAMLTTVLYLLFIQLLLSFEFLSLGNAADVSDLIQQDPILKTIRTALLILVSICFFVYFWTRGGQTIGMRAWRLKVQQVGGARITVKQAIIRAATALGGLGNLAVFVNLKQPRALQDYLAGTEIITLSKEENKRIYKSLD